MEVLKLLFTLVCFSCYCAGQAPNTTFTSFTQFSNGRRFDVGALLAALNIPHVQEFAPSRNSSVPGFSAADRNHNSRRANRNFNQIFDTSGGNEFVNTNNVTEDANTDQDQLIRLVDQTGIDTAQSFDVDGNPTDEGVAEVSLRLQQTCAFNLPNTQACNSSFREPTGRCANLLSGIKTWGMAGTPFTRVLAPVYEDGIQERRTTEFSSGHQLKSPREISTLVTDTKVVLNMDGLTSQLMQWGQYIAHEFTQLGQEEGHVECCPDAIFKARSGENAVPTQAQLEEIRREIALDRGDICQQIEVNVDGALGGYTCMSVTRSRPAPLHDCALGPRQQANAVSHVFDASVVYGSSLAEQNKLREHRGGLMKTQTVNGHTLPPPNPDTCDAEQKAANRCPFLGGDSRINVTPNLASLHTVAIIKHNQFASQLAEKNPHWDDERLFQEARRIIYSIESNVHYYEFLPLVLGPSLIHRYRLTTYAGHEAATNPSTLSELAGAAFRFGHSLINGFFRIKTDNGTVDFLNLRTHFFDNTLNYEGGIAQCVRGLLDDEPWVTDNNYPFQMRDFLFDKRLDIVSLNINRGRDHGFQSYVEYRRHYGLTIPQSWEDLSTTHSADVIAKLKLAYTTVNDVELYVGGITENHATGAIVGELFGNIIGDGFARLQRGDRFYFESPHSGLNSEQIQAIKLYKYSQFLCEGASLPRISNNAYLKAGSLGAEEVECTSFTPLNLDLWKEETGTPKTPVCQWQITDTGGCCLGRRQTTRKCVGDVNCNCPGNAIESEPCSCEGWRCYLNMAEKCKGALGTGGWSSSRWNSGRWRV